MASMMTKVTNAVWARNKNKIPNAEEFISLRLSLTPFLLLLFIPCFSSALPASLHFPDTGLFDRCISGYCLIV